jgi:hypothetical protein
VPFPFLIKAGYRDVEEIEMVRETGDFEVDGDGEGEGDEDDEGDEGRWRYLKEDGDIETMSPAFLGDADPNSVRH